MALTKIMDKSMAEAKESITLALSKIGFGILTEIDVAATLKNKIGVDRSPLVILGACNPKLANEALDAEPSFALLMPCNVVLEGSDTNRTTVTIVDPRDLVHNSKLSELANNASKLLEQALEDA